MICYICKSSNLTQFLSLGHQPPSDAFVKANELNLPKTNYPLELFYCSICTLVQLGYEVDPEILFRDYVYNSGSNNALRENFKILVAHIVDRYALTPDDLAVDIGSNDGTLLENYLPFGVRILGIDPSSVTSIAIAKGIPTLVDFFNNESAREATSKYGKAKIITGTNVFAHVADLDSFMRGVDELLASDGIFITESGYVADMVEGMQYDSIYHEHLRYYSVRSLMTLFENFSMEIIDIEKIESHGGSIRVYAARKGARSISPRVAELCGEEEAQGYHRLDTYSAFAKNIVDTKFKLLELVLGLKKSGARIVGIGAPAKGNTLLNYCKLDPDMIDYLAERSPLKIGLYSPGMHIPVVDEARILEEQPEAAIILSWNIADELVSKLRKIGYTGKFIIPNPIPRIIEN